MPLAPDALRQRHLGGASMQELLRPSRGSRDDIRLMGGVPKDHARINRQRLREQQAQVKAEKEQLQKIKSMPLPQSSKYAHLSSKVQTRRSSAQLKQGDISPTEAILESLDASLAATKLEDVVKPVKSRSRTPSSSTSGINHIALNAQSAKTFVRKVAPPPSVKQVERTTPLGAIPSYLLNKRAEQAASIAAAEAARNAPPPGLRLLSKEEQSSTLEELQKSHADRTRDLLLLPMGVDNGAVRRRRQQLDSNLQELEKAIVLFQKEKVYVALDDPSEEDKSNTSVQDLVKQTERIIPEKPKPLTRGETVASLFNQS